MPLPSNFKDLTKIDRRKQWKLLKTKHSKAISAAKLDFDQKFGPALDKFQAQVDKLTKLAATTNLNTNQIQPVLDTLKPLKTIAASYQSKAAALGDPAKKELTALLKAIQSDATSWEALAVALMSQMPAAATNAEAQAATELVHYLDEVRKMAHTYVTRGERAVVAYQTQPGNPRPEAAALASRVVEAARTAGPSAYEAANAAENVSGGTNYPLFKARATAAAPLILRLRKAADTFMAGWDFDAAVMTISGDVDAMAMKGNYEQLKQYCDSALKLIKKLP